MKITYKIKQYDVDDFVVIITSPEYFAGLYTRIHTPHFLLSELQQHIRTNLNQTIHRFCIKHNEYVDILKTESFEFEPDEQDKHGFGDNPCWFYTGKFIDDTELNISDEDKDAISYKNLIRYDYSYTASHDIHYQLVADPRWMKCKSGVIKIKSLEPHKAIDATRVHASFGIGFPEIYKWVTYQKRFAPNKGNTYGTQTVFPRHIKKEDGAICFPISELQKYLNILYKRGHMGHHPQVKCLKKYNNITSYIINYSKTHTPLEMRAKFGL